MAERLLAAFGDMKLNFGNNADHRQQERGKIFICFEVWVTFIRGNSLQDICLPSGAEFLIVQVNIVHMRKKLSFLTT